MNEEKYKKVQIKYEEFNTLLEIIKRMEGGDFNV